MNNISKDLDIEKNIRGYEFSESSRHMSNQIDKEDLITGKTVKLNYKNISHRYYNINLSISKLINLIFGIEMRLTQIVLKAKFHGTKQNI